MAQSVKIAGALFSNVPSIQVPDENDVFHPFVDPSPTTATASDVASGKIFFAADGTQTSGTASGGSATIVSKTITSNGTYNASADSADGYDPVVVNVPGAITGACVVGKFTGTTAGTKTITIPYTGNGYPLSIFIFPSEGAQDSDGDFYSTLARYSIVYIALTKERGTTPNYSTTTPANYARGSARYKSSASSASTTTTSNPTSIQLYDTNSPTGSSSANAVKLNSATQFSVYIKTASDGNYGFLAGTEYSYVIGYSS